MNMRRSFTGWPLHLFQDVVDTFSWTRKISEVHLHHTFKPTVADYRGEQTIYAMWSYHTVENKWDDIGQHVTVAPDGTIWSGRDWNKPPASETHANGTGTRGPFMIEMIGNFDVGADVLVNPQRRRTLAVIASIQTRFGLATNQLRFHRQLIQPPKAVKSCPGTSLDYAQFLHELRAYRAGMEDANGF